MIRGLRFIYICIGVTFFLSVGIVLNAQEAAEQERTGGGMPEGRSEVMQTKDSGQHSKEDIDSQRLKHTDPIKLVNKSAFCIECHREEDPAIFEDWLNSTHARVGVGCAECHSSSPGDRNSFLHKEKYYISAIVTPFVCAKCHKDIMRDYATGSHSNTLKMLQEMKEDDPRYPVISLYKEDEFRQCSGCHGGEVKVRDDHRPDSASWPNSGAGRLNPDRSSGTCTACHMGHRYSVSAARQPETCLRCHDGRNYPEGEIYRHSAHGVAYETQTDKEALKRLGFFFEGKQMLSPTCAFCHMNGSGHGLLTRHNAAWRLSRDLKHPEAPSVPRGENFRNNMKAVCNQCHAVSTIDRFFENADAMLKVYQENVVTPKLAVFKQKLSSGQGQERDRLLEEYSRFLAESKSYRMNLYMGRHGNTQR